MHKDDERFELAEWSIEPSLLRLTRGGEARSVGAKVMGVLLCLAGRPGELVSKDELVAEVWDGDAASDEALTAVVYELRRALGDDARRPRFIGTIRGRGYRLLVAPSCSGAAQAERAHRPTAPPALLRAAEHGPPGPSSGGTGGGRTAAGAGRRRISVAAFSLIAAGMLCALVLQRDVHTVAQPPLPVAGSAPDEIRSVAVLALEPRGAQPSQEPSLFARGLSERLANELARSGWLDVVPAFSRALADSRWLPSYPSRLSSRPVDAVVEGAVRRQGQRLLVTVQLIAADGQLLWGGSWERVASDLAALEAELGSEIAKRLRGRLGTSARLAHSPEVDEALRLGHHFLGVDEPGEARRYFSFALERQPTLAQAHVGLAESLLAAVEGRAPEQRGAAVEAARRAARTALEIDADLPAAHASLGTIALVHEGDIGSAGRHFERAELSAGAPSSSLRGYAAFLSAIARHDEAIELSRRALVASPASVEGRLDLARVLYFAERFDEALAELLVLDQLAPLEARSARLRTQILLVQGKHRLAVEACRQALQLAGDPEGFADLLGELYEEVGLEGVVRCLRDLPAGGAGALPFGPMHLARMEAVRGDAGAALGLLRLAQEQDSPELVWLAVDPAFWPLHGLAAFEELVAARRLSA